MSVPLLAEGIVIDTVPQPVSAKVPAVGTGTRLTLRGDVAWLALQLRLADWVLSGVAPAGRPAALPVGARSARAPPSSLVSYRRVWGLPRKSSAMEVALETSTSSC